MMYSCTCIYMYMQKGCNHWIGFEPVNFWKAFCHYIYMYMLSQNSGAHGLISHVAQCFFTILF